MSNDSTQNQNNDSVEEKKKQKAGLNAVRPGDFLEQKFKELAKEYNISQTEFFERIFLSYLSDIREDKREKAISFDSEINLISKNLESIMQHFKSIAIKSQDTAISLRDNKEQSEKNLKTEMDTLKLRVNELTKRNEELESSNKIFSQVKEGFEEKIIKLTEKNKEKEVENRKLVEDVNAKNIRVKDYEKTIENIEKEKKNLKNEATDLIEKLLQKDSKLSVLESTNSSLNNTVNNMEALKKSEISSVEERFRYEIETLKSKIRELNIEKVKELNLLKGRLEEFKIEKERELNVLKSSLQAEYEADKKLALSQVLVELADMKVKYAELQGEYNKLNQRKKSTYNIKSK